jgi:hypothetical protein
MSIRFLTDTWRKKESGVYAVAARLVPSRQWKILDGYLCVDLQAGTHRSPAGCHTRRQHASSTLSGLQRKSDGGRKAAVAV